MDTVHIIPFEDRFAEDFRRINLEWLDQYGFTEANDLLVLDHPRKNLLDKGGFIFLAVCNDQLVGCAGLLKETDGFELVKMTVVPDFRGRGISRQLLETCLETAKAAGATHVLLYSNHQLKTALGLYGKYGFKHVEVTGDRPFVTSDVKMELYF
jgi:putative acetyltransferase